MKLIPYGRQDINQQDIEAVVQVLMSDWLTQGPAVERFEKTVSEYCGVKYAVAVSSATAALHISCIAAGLGSGDLLWTSPNTFVASANCGLYCGANVDFVDIDPNTYNLSVESLELKLKKAKQIGKIPKVLVPVHFAGQSCEMQSIAELASHYGCSVIEDASHAVGGNYRQKKIGCCDYSDMTVFSFHPVKIITTGEGGIVLTNKRNLYEKLIRLRTHGITRNPELMEGTNHEPWYYQQIELGYNYRMTDIQAALGNSQMDRLDDFITRRHILVKRYNDGLADLPITLPWQHPDTYSAYHLYVIRLHLDKINKSHVEVFEELRRANINVNLHYIPVHTQFYYRKLGFRTGDFPESEKYYQEAITLPLFYSMSEAQQDYMIEILRKVLS